MASRKGRKPSGAQPSPSIQFTHEPPSAAMSRPFPRVAIATMNQSKGRTLPSRDTSSRLFVNLPTSPFPDQGPLEILGLMNLQRPAIPRPELKQVTQITQQIKAIESITTFTVTERLAIISDVASCLPALHKLLQGNKVSRALAAKARKLIALLNAATVVEKDNLEQILHFLSQARLPEGLTREDFVEYVDTLESFISLVRPFAKEVGLHESWQEVVVSVLQQYFRLLPDTGTGETPVDPSPHSFNSWTTNESFQPLTPPNTTETAHSPVNTLFVLPCMEELPQVDDSLDQETAMETLQSIMIYLTQWNRLNPTLYRENATTFLPNLVLIVDTLDAIDSVNNRILSSEHVQEYLAACLDIWTSFAQIWGTAVEDALAERLWLLAEQARASPKQVPEAVFSHIMDEIRALSRHLLLETPTVLSNQEEGGFIDSKFALRARKFCKLLHHHWQGQAYQSELHQLWLLIWRSLRVLYKVKEKTGIFQRAEKGFIDAAFFDKPGVSATFARLVKTSDAANPRSVEDMVAQYCRLIGKCRSDPDDRYDHLRHYKETKLRPHVITSLERFIETHQAKDNLLQKLHRAVVRFNFITKGPATVRRWGTDGTEQDWAIELLDLTSPTKAFAPGPNSPTFLRPEDETPIKDNFFKPSPTTLPHPTGINVKSSFDYVYYPLPETRAHEVAQSALISRDLRDPGTVSHGLRIEDLVNIPPRHVRGPSNLSPFEWPAFVTPNEVIRAVRDRFSQVRSGFWRSLGLTPSERTHHLESTLNANTRRAKALNRARVSKPALAKRSIRLRGGAGSQHASSGSRQAQAGSQDASGATSDQMENQDQNPPSQAYIQQHIQNFRAQAQCGEDYDAIFIKVYLERTSWDVANAVKEFKAIQQFEKQSFFGALGYEYWQTKIAYLERHDWDVKSALADFVIQMAAFKSRLEPCEMIPDIEIAKYFVAGITQPDDAMSEYQQDLAKIVSDFKGAIVPGDKISRTEILETYRQQGNNLNDAVNFHLESRQFGAPCYKCPEVPGSAHHHCECESHTPNFLETEARRDRSKFLDPTTCHACPYFPGEYHHPRTPLPNWPAYLQRPERCKHKDDSRHVFDVFTANKFRDLLSTLNMAPTSVLPFLLGPDGFGVPKLDDRLWRRTISAVIANLTNTTRELRTILVTSFIRYENLPMDDVENYIRRRPDPAQASTVELCRRAAIDLKAYFDRLSDIMAGPHRRYTMLGFRHAFGRFIRTGKELRSLYLDLVMRNDFDEQDVPGLHWRSISNRIPAAQDEPGSDLGEDGNQANHPGGGNYPRREDDELDTSDSDDVHSLSGDEAPQMRSQSPQGEMATPVATNIKPRRLPTYEDYNRMYMDELQRELLVERKVNSKVLEQYLRKHDRIQLLMRLDNRGVYGEGARNGYYAITGNLKGRPADWLQNSENLIKDLKLSRKDKFNAARIQRRDKRRLANRRRRIRNADREDRRREARQGNPHQGAVDLADISDDSDVSENTDDGILRSTSTAKSPSESSSFDLGFPTSPDRSPIISESQRTASTQISSSQSEPRRNENEQVDDQQNQADDAAQEHTRTRSPAAPARPLRKRLRVISDPPT